jgi:hypothetical protein
LGSSPPLKCALLASFIEIMRRASLLLLFKGLRSLLFVNLLVYLLPIHFEVKPDVIIDSELDGRL